MLCFSISLLISISFDFLRCFVVNILPIYLHYYHCCCCRCYTYGNRTITCRSITRTLGFTFCTSFFFAYALCYLPSLASAWLYYCCSLLVGVNIYILHDDNANVVDDDGRQAGKESLISHQYKWVRGGANTQISTHTRAYSRKCNNFALLIWGKWVINFFSVIFYYFTSCCCCCHSCYCYYIVDVVVCREY